MARKKTPEELRREREKKLFGNTSTIDGFIDDARRTDPTTILPQPQISPSTKSLNQIKNDVRLEQMVSETTTAQQLSQITNQQLGQLQNTTGSFSPSMGGLPSMLAGAMLGGAPFSPDQRTMSPLGETIKPIHRSPLPTDAWSRGDPEVEGDWLNTLLMGGTLGTLGWAGKDIYSTYNRKQAEKLLARAAGVEDPPFKVRKPTSKKAQMRSRLNPMRWMTAGKKIPLTSTGKRKPYPVQEYTTPEGEPMTRKEALIKADEWVEEKKAEEFKERYGQEGQEKSTKPKKEGGLWQKTKEAIVGKDPVPFKNMTHDQINDFLVKEGMEPVPKEDGITKARDKLTELGYGDVTPEATKPEKPRVKMNPDGTFSPVEEKPKMGPEVAPEPVYDKPMHPRDAWVKNQVDKHISEVIEKSAASGNPLTEAEIAERRVARAQQWNQVKPDVVNKAMEQELIKIGQTKGWTAAAAHHTANTLHKSGRPFNEMELQKMGEALEMQAAGKGIRAETRVGMGMGGTDFSQVRTQLAAEAAAARNMARNPVRAGMSAAAVAALPETVPAAVRGAGGILESRPEWMGGRGAGALTDWGADTPGAAGGFAYDVGAATANVGKGLVDFAGNLLPFRPGGGGMFGSGIDPSLSPRHMANVFAGPTIRALGGDTSALEGSIDYGYGTGARNITGDWEVPTDPGAAGRFVEDWRGVPGDLRTMARPITDPLNDFVDSLIRKDAPVPSSPYFGGASRYR